MRYGIGIDTGGTYTDAVIMEFETNSVLAYAKALTTKDDLSVGIGNALDKLPNELLQQADFVALSTTLATNACVENKGGRASMLFFGVEQKIAREDANAYGLCFAENTLFFDEETHFDGRVCREPDWDAVRASAELLRGQSAAVVELYAMKNGAVIEKKAAKLLQEEFEIPVICGHELFDDLNSIKRGSSTLLNAKLISVIQEFLGAISTALKKRNLSLPVVIVRSDGTLMSEAFTRLHPVETLLCGPAASVTGGALLGGEENCLIVDIGGTTTDIAVIEDGIPKKAGGGVQIGKWQTFVKGVYIDTFALGGDTQVVYKDGKVSLGTAKVLPLCALASEYPSILPQLEKLATEHTMHGYPLYEYLLVVKDISGSSLYSKKEKMLCALLKNNPLSIKDAAAQLGETVYSLQTQRLENEGIIRRAGLTPTDIMHIKNEFSLFDAQASFLGVKFVAENTEQSTEQLCDLVYDMAIKRLYVGICRVLLAHENPTADTANQAFENFIEFCYDNAKNKKTPTLTARFETKMALVGIGAPTHIFLPRVAELLNTKCVIPKHAGVANAIGAVIGNISASATVCVRPHAVGEAFEQYSVFYEGGMMQFDELDAAVEQAKIFAREEAKQKAREHGATGKLKTILNIDEDNAPLACGSVYLGTDVIATSIGRIGL